MRKNSRWGYLLFMAALIVGSIVYLHDFGILLMLPSFAFLPLVYRRLSASHRLWWLVPIGLVSVCGLGGLYYFADLMIFPHSARALYRLHDACAMGLLWTVGGFLIAWIENYKPRQHVTIRSRTMR